MIIQRRNNIRLNQDSGVKIESSLQQASKDLTLEDQEGCKTQKSVTKKWEKPNTAED